MVLKVDLSVIVNPQKCKWCHGFCHVQNCFNIRTIKPIKPRLNGLLLHYEHCIILFIFIKAKISRSAIVINFPLQVWPLTLNLRNRVRTSIPPIMVMALRMSGWTLISRRTLKDPILHLKSSVSNRFVSTWQRKGLHNLRAWVQILPGAGLFSLLCLRILSAMYP